MSYIRCLSNPESLYVWGDVYGVTYFSWWEDNNEHPMIGVPSSQVNKFFIELYKWETFDYKDISINQPFSHDNMSVVECYILTGEKDEFGCLEGKWRIKLTLGPGLPDLIMWKVTWEYLKNSFYNHVPDIPWYRRWNQKLKKWIRR